MTSTGELYSNFLSYSYPHFVSPAPLRFGISLFPVFKIFKMAGSTFFGKSWIGREFEFTWPQPSSWKITTKVSEKFAQLTLRNLETVGGPKFSYTYGVFLCQNTNNAREAFLKVYKQIPHIGTEGEPYTIRKEQAGTRTHHDIEAYKWFAEKQAKHLPICLAHKMGIQDNYDFVPDGYIHYVMYSKVPGLRLDEQRFWSLETFERDAVRNAFLPAYK